MEFQVVIPVLISFAISVVLGPIIIPFLRKLKMGQTERTEGVQSHLKKAGTPTMGGVLIVIVMLITNLIVSDISNSFIILLLISMLGFASIGFIDDYKKFTVNKKGLSGKKKLLGQGIIGSLVWCSSL